MNDKYHTINNILNGTLQNNDDNINQMIEHIKKRNKVNMEHIVNFYENSDNPIAIFFLGFIYENGYDTSININTAIRMYKLSGTSYALNALGTLYNNGNGVTRDYKTAFNYFTEAAKLGLEKAYNNIGIMYLNGLIESSNKYYLSYNYFLKAGKYGKENIDNLMRDDKIKMIINCEKRLEKLEDRVGKMEGNLYKHIEYCTCKEKNEYITL